MLLYTNRFMIKDKWTLIVVESELLPIHSEIDNEVHDTELEIGTKVKECFNSKPKKLMTLCI